MSATNEFDNKVFRRALGAFATGVTVVTARDASGRDVGLTASSFNSVSLDPPMVLWSLSKGCGSFPAFMQAEHFAVHVLACDQQDLSDRFAKRGTDKFAGLDPKRGTCDLPLLEGCSARFQCRTQFRYEGGDHVILVGEVLAFEHGDREPLIFHSGRYGKVLPRLPAAAAASDEVDGSYRKDFLGYLTGLVSTLMYRPLRQRCAEMGLAEGAYFVLTLLAARQSCTVGEVEAFLNLARYSPQTGLLDGLAAAGLITGDIANDKSQLALTEAGRRIAIEFFAIAKAAEADVSRALDYEDAHLLKQLLKRVIRNMELPQVMKSKTDARGSGRMAEGTDVVRPR